VVAPFPGDFAAGIEGRMLDETTTIAELRARMAHFVARRAWEQFHTPKNLASSIAIEAAEIMEHFQWHTAEESIARMHDPVLRANVADELADVMLYCFSFANATGIDISEAVFKKLARNEVRFPVARVSDLLDT
jgi:NTP pyrophosphatase (non-canonical NTP hydrolase)